MATWFKPNPQRLLLRGIQSNRVDLLSKALDSGANLQELLPERIRWSIHRDGFHREVTWQGPLHVALHSGSKEALDWLLEQGADVLKPIRGLYPMHLAVYLYSENADPKPSVIDGKPALDFQTVYLKMIESLWTHMEERGFSDALNWDEGYPQHLWHASILPYLQTEWVQHRLDKAVPKVSGNLSKPLRL